MSNIKELQERALGEERWVNFWKQHPTYRNQANRNLMEGYMNQNMLSPASANGAEALEIAFLATGRSLSENAATQQRHARATAAAERAEADRLTAEAAEAERSAAEQPGDIGPNGRPVGETWSKERLNQYLRDHDSRYNRNIAQPTLPEDVTAERIQTMPVSELHSLQRKFGLKALNDRLQGIA